MSEVMSDIPPFIASLPKAELHMHLEGSLEPETLLALAQRNGVRLPFSDAAALRRAYVFDSLQSFLDLYYLGLTVLRTGADFFEMTQAYLARAARENIRHAEVFVSPQAHLRRGLPIAAIIENILAAFDAAHKIHGITGGLIAGIQRQFDEADALDMIAALKPWRDHILGLGLGGPEIGHPPSKFRRAFAVARADYGWGTVAHAGEEGGAEYVRDALDALAVDRVDHGVRADTDPDLVRRLAEERIPLTVCPCSNVMLRLFPDMKSHNIRKLHEAGLCITVNSDDPPYFGGYINENYAAIKAALDLTDEDLWQMARNSFVGAYLSDELRSRYLCELEDHRPKLEIP
jgi:adenosine deaminase